ncbi:MAG: Uma2 family endonuclease [Chloroflexota bacterium]
MTVSDYLALDAESNIKHEYARGRVYAMAEVSVKHNIINNNVSTIFNNQLFDTACIVISSDVRLKVDSADVSYRYPDTVIICDEVKLSEDTVQTITNPTVIVEVLSPSTALRDYNEKLAEYTQLDSLQHYLLISQHTPKVEVFSRDEVGGWGDALFTGLDTSINLDSVDVNLSLARIYNKVDFDTEDDA